MEPVSSEVSWSASSGLGTIQVTCETLDWSQMWRYGNAYILTCSPRGHYLWFTYLIYLIVYFETCTVYIFTPTYSHILAYWLMLSVLQITENKFYLIFILSCLPLVQDRIDPVPDIHWNIFPTFQADQRPPQTFTFDCDTSASDETPLSGLWSQ